MNSMERKSLMRKLRKANDDFAALLARCNELPEYLTKYSKPFRERFTEDISSEAPHFQTFVIQRFGQRHEIGAICMGLIFSPSGKIQVALTAQGYSPKFKVWYHRPITKTDSVPLILRRDPSVFLDVFSDISALLRTFINCFTFRELSCREG